METPRIRLTTASDYAALDVGDHAYYYGYEFERDGEDDAEATWGFQYKRGAASVRRIPYRALVAGIARAPEVWDTQACLLLGLGHLLAAD